MVVFIRDYEDQQGERFFTVFWTLQVLRPRVPEGISKVFRNPRSFAADHGPSLPRGLESSAIKRWAKLVSHLRELSIVMRALVGEGLQVGGRWITRDMSDSSFERCPTIRDRQWLKRLLRLSSEKRGVIIHKKEP